MKKIYIGSLTLVVTENCNLNCSHCLRGNARNNEITEEVIAATLSQIKFINTLTISGGEITLALDKIVKIIDYIIKNEIIVRNIAFFTNGVCYNKSFLDILHWIDKELKQLKYGNTSTVFYLSHDEYHLADISKKGLFLEYMTSIQSYEKDIHFINYKSPSKLLREGRAELLDPSLSTPFKPAHLYMSYLIAYKKFFNTHLEFNQELGTCFINEVAISTKGFVTESNASFEHMETIYNYGNVFDDTIENICLKRKPKIVHPENMSKYNKMYLKKYL